MILDGTPIRIPVHGPRPLQVLSGPKGDAGAPGGSDAAQAGWINDPASATRAALSATYAAVFTPEKYGAAGNGTTDDTSAVQSAIQAAYAAGGGVVQFAAKTYRIDGQLAIPNDAAAPVAHQPTITLRGQGAIFDGKWQGFGTVPGATTLDLRSTTGPAKVDTRGLGLLIVERLNLTQKAAATDTNPFFQTTNTTVFVRECSFFGHSTLTGSACVQDALVFGGTTTGSDNTATAAFQGYGSVVERCYFARIRRCFYGRVYANSVIVRDNTVSHSCGATSPIGAFELDGGAGFISGTLFTGNLIEQYGYAYGIRMVAKATHIIALGNAFWDGSASSLAAYRCETGNHITVHGAHRDGTIPTTISDAEGSSWGLVPEGFIGGTNGVTFQTVTSFNAALQVLNGQKLLHRDNGTLVNQHLADWGTGSGIGIITIENAGNPTTRRILNVWDATFAQFVRLDPAKGVLTGPGMVVQSGRNATASRPTGLGAGDAGAMFFDTTLNKPIWWNGSGWRDATGTAV